jgi:hypothetical protein
MNVPISLLLSVPLQSITIILLYFAVSVFECKEHHLRNHKLIMNYDLRRIRVKVIVTCLKILS